MRFTIGALLLLAMTAAHARAQNLPTRSTFVEGSLLVDRDPTYPNPSRQTELRPGGGAAVGTRLTRHSRYSIRFDFELPDSHVSDVYPVGLRTERRTNAYGLLLGRHFQPNRSVELTVVGGFSATQARRSIVIDQRSIAMSQSTDWMPAVSTGVDVAIGLTPHLALVPELRFHMSPAYPSLSLIIARPRIAVRWRF